MALSFLGDPKIMFLGMRGQGNGGVGTREWRSGDRGMEEW